MLWRRTKPEPEVVYIPLKYMVVETPITARLPGLTGPELRASLEALSQHPAFAWLVQRLRIQRAALERHLAGTRQETLRDTDFIQSGIYWTGWLEREVNKLTSRPEPQAKEPQEDVLEAFNAINSALERVGEQPQAEQ